MSQAQVATAFRFEAEPQIGRYSQAQPDRLAHERQLHYDLTTQFAEIVNGAMRTEFELKFTGEDLVGEDGSSMDKVTFDAIKEAKTLADTNPFFDFEVRRRQHERDEYEELKQMAAGKGPNTMITISDFPPELYNHGQDVGGYNVRRKQTMMRVMVRKPDGNIQMYSQSLDHSDRQALEDIYARFGEQPNEGELLGQRIRANVAWGQEDNLTDELTDIYDKSLSETRGGEWYAGRQPLDARNTYEFVCRQTDVIDHCIQMEAEGLLDDHYMYNIAATLQSRFEEEQRNDVGNLIRLSTGSGAIGHEVLARLQYEIISAGIRAAEQGQTFSGCGVTMSSGGRSGLGRGLKEAGFGSKLSAGEDQYGSLEFNCPHCNTTNRRESGKLKSNCSSCNGDVRC